jgi:ferredoxin
MGFARADIDKDRCEGHGRCYASFPELFDSDDDGFAEARDVSCPEGTTLDGSLIAAAQGCPEHAIGIIRFGLADDEKAGQ